jgi:hypothetical protein
LTYSQHRHHFTFFEKEKNMFEPLDSEVFWLNVTNILLGLVTLAAFVAVATVAVKEITARVREKAAARLTNDDHAFLHDTLGLTMADGGERLAVPPAPEKSPKKGSKK